MACLLTAVSLAMAAIVWRKVWLHRAGVWVGKGMRSMDESSSEWWRGESHQFAARGLDPKDIFFFLNFIYFFFFFFAVHDTRWLTCAVTYKTGDKPLAAFLLPFSRVLRDKAGRGHDRRVCVRVRACTLDAVVTTALQKSQCCTGNATTRLHDIGASPTMQFAIAWRNDLVSYALVHHGAPWLLQPHINASCYHFLPKSSRNLDYSSRKIICSGLVQNKQKYLFDTI